MASRFGPPSNDNAAFLPMSAYKRAAIEQAVAEAKKGIFVSGEAVDRWVASWDTDAELPFPEPDIFLYGRDGLPPQ